MQSLHKDHLVIQRDFDPEVARKIGTDSAIMLENFVFWIGNNKANNKHFHEGRYWTYNSAEALAILFPYLTTSNIEYILKKLKEAKYIATGNFNKNGYDRTNWYAITDNYAQKRGLKATPQNRGIDSLNLGNGFPKIEEPIPDDNTDYKPNNKLKINSTNTPEVGVLTSSDKSSTLSESQRRKIAADARRGRKLGFKTAPKVYPKYEKKSKAGIDAEHIR